jgi:predicted outer membrane protein
MTSRRSPQLETFGQLMSQTTFLFEQKPRTRNFELPALLSSVAAISLMLAGCASTTATAPPGSHASASDLSFVTNLYNVVDFDRQVTDELLAKNPDPRVAALARDLLAQGDSLEARVAPIAAAEGILPPVGQRFAQRADLQVKIASVMGSNPINYDQEYLADEVYSHEQALQSAREMADQPGGNPQLMAISTDATGVLQTNLSRLRTLQSQVVVDAR